MLTRPSFITEPGTFAPKRREMPSSGWMCMTRRLVSRSLDGGVAEKHERRAAELDDDFGCALSEAFAGAQIKGNAGPAPVVDL